MNMAYSLVIRREGGSNSNIVIKATRPNTASSRWPFRMFPWNSSDFGVLMKDKLCLVIALKLP